MAFTDASIQTKIRLFKTHDKAARFVDHVHSQISAAIDHSLYFVVVSFDDFRDVAPRELARWARAYGFENGIDVFCLAADGRYGRSVGDELDDSSSRHLDESPLRLVFDWI